MGLKELVGGTLFDNMTVFKNHDDVGPAGCGEPMGNDEGSAGTLNVGLRVGMEEGGEGLLDKSFALAVEGAGGFIENEDFGLCEQGTGNADALTLTATEKGTAVANWGEIALRKSGDELVGTRGTGGLFYLLGGGVWHAIGYVGHDGVVKQKCLLRHHAYAPAQRGTIKSLQGDTIDKDLAAVGIVEPQQEVGKGRLSGPRTAYQGNSGSTGNGE